MRFWSTMIWGCNAAVLAGALILVGAVRGEESEGKQEEPKGEQSLSNDIPSAVLGWRNGDTLSGQILSSSEDRLIWKAKEFISPFRLDARQLHNIRFPDNYLGEEGSNSSQFRVTFSNGDRLFGDLVEINSSTVTFHCPKLSREIQVARRFLHRIERVSGSRLRYSGPTELDQWKALGRSGKDADWFLETTGEFATNRWGGELFRAIGFPEKVEVAFSISCANERPNFEIGVTEEPSSGPRIETWDDTLVLTSENRFSPIAHLSDTTRNLDLRIFWDQSKEEVRVCDADGVTLAQLDQIPFKASSAKGSAKNGSPRRSSSNSRNPGITGFRLLNRTTEISLSRLTVREWDGKNIPRFDATKPRVELSGGDNIFNLDSLQLRSGQGLQVGTRKMPLEAIDQLVFSTDRWVPDKEPHARIAWADGTLISGRFSELDHRSATLKPSWFKESITAELKQAKELFFSEVKDPVITGSDKIKTGNVTLRGVLTPGWNDGYHTLLAWRPPGSENASPLAESQEAEVTREAYPGATELVGDARIYLTNDEVIAGKLARIDQDNVEFESELTGRVLIPNERVRAVDIEGAGLAPHGFVDKGWQVLKSESKNAPADLENGEEDVEAPGVVMEKDKVIMREGGFGHMNLLVGDRIRFHTKWQQSYGAITLRLFCSDFDRNSPSTDLIIAAQGNRILVGQLKRGGGFSFSGEQVAIKDQKAEIEVMARHDKIAISVNGKESLTMEVQPSQVSGNGLVIQMGGGWRGWNSNANEVEFTKFSVDRSPGYLPKRIIDASAKENALTIPRFHRDDPPTHVLVAPNGDLLRGKLISALGDRIHFVSRDTEVDLPRSRVSAIIWLRELSVSDGEKEGDGEAEKETGTVPTFSENTHQFLLHDGTRLNLTKGNINQEQAIFIGKSSILGTCRVPFEKLRRSKQGPYHKLGRTSSSTQMPYTDWVMKHTPDPAIPKGDGSEDSPLVGTVAPDFSIPLLDGGMFSLGQHKGRVVVLDFWATWCGPCIRAMPEVFRALSIYRDHPVVFCAVNQAETPPIINQFLESRGWNGTTVGLDFELTTSREYQVKGIPQTVVIGKEGKIAWVHTGFDADLSKKLAQAISRALQKK